MTKPREIISSPRSSSVQFSICTLVTKPAEYDEMRQSFEAAGFSDDNSEFLYIDNSEQNKADAFEAVNWFLLESVGEFVIICHQDVRLHDHNITHLETLISELSEVDPRWAVLGNAGGVEPGRLAIRITDPKGTDTAKGPFPQRVDAIDENFMIARRSANLAVSSDLDGYHFYGTDLCIVADVLGYTSYVIDFHLHHIGGESTKKGKSKHSFHSSYPIVRAALIDKYGRAFRPRWIQNTGTIIYLTGSWVRRKIFNSKPGVDFCKFIGKLRNREYR